jgi:hypothetical protein
MATTDKAWDGSASRWPDAKSYCNSTLLNGNTSDDPDEWTKDACKLPVREPSGEINTNALSSAAAVLNGGMGGLKGVAPKDRKAAARKLIGLYSEAQMPPPDSLKKIAGM